MMKKGSGNSLSVLGQKHITDWQRSGLSQSEYCRRVGVSSSSLSTWKSKSEPRSKEATGAKASLGATGSFINLREPSVAELEFPGGIKVKLTSSAELGLLRLLKEAYGA